MRDAEISSGAAHLPGRGDRGTGVGFSTMTYRANTGGSGGGELDARFNFTCATAYMTFAF
ncbi:MAG: hypothetical protein MUF10_00410 [Thermoanaerobaculaceae bacterium]|nr:hypothetical protein [Thermoanaerobaculaceae bacterium]